jgi:hypothetical protein
MRGLMHDEKKMAQTGETVCARDVLARLDLGERGAGAPLYSAATA